MKQIVVDEKTFGKYMSDLYRKVHAGKTVRITEQIEDDKDNEIDFTGSMEACIQDLRQRMKQHAS